MQPSYYEGFGNAVLEAMSYGLVAIGSRNTTQAEVIGDSGIMVEEIEPDSIAKAIAGYLSLSSEDCLQGRKRVLKTIYERHLFKYRLNKFLKIIDAEGK